MMSAVRYRRYHFRHRETITTVLAEGDEYFEVAKKAMLEARKRIEDFIKRDPFFYSTLEPYDCEGEVVGRMCEASKLAGVGPMAAVAGTIAGYAVERMVEEGASFAVVDNGGDIAMYIDEPLTIGVYAGKEKSIAFRIEPEDRIKSVCTSSGRIGPSISFGDTDAATVFGYDASVADAFATALGNAIKGHYGKEEIEEALKTFWENAREHLTAAVVIKDGVVALAGEVPEVVAAKIDADLITRG